jgi:hypothetical protein
MSFVANVASRLDGTNPSLSPFNWTCPEVKPYAPIYFYQFAQFGAESQWTSRFTVIAFVDITSNSASHDVCRSHPLADSRYPRRKARSQTATPFLGETDPLQSPRLVVTTRQPRMVQPQLDIILIWAWILIVRQMTTLVITTQTPTQDVRPTIARGMAHLLQHRPQPDPRGHARVGWRQCVQVLQSPPRSACHPHWPSTRQVQPLWTPTVPTMRMFCNRRGFFHLCWCSVSAWCMHDQTTVDECSKFILVH